MSKCSRCANELKCDDCQSTGSTIMLIVWSLVLVFSYFVIDIKKRVDAIESSIQQKEAR